MRAANELWVSPQLLHQLFMVGPHPAYGITQGPGLGATIIDARWDEAAGMVVLVYDREVPEVWAEHEFVTMALRQSWWKRLLRRL